MTKRQEHPVFRRTRLALAIALMFSAGTVMAKDVVIEDGTITDNLVADYAVGDSASATGSSLTIIKSNVNAPEIVAAGYAHYAGTGTAMASDNKLTINGSLVSTESIAGGASQVNDGSATSNTNTINIGADSKVFGTIYAGTATVDGNGTATANNNAVNIGAGSEVSGTIYAGTATVDGNGTATANNNTINISGQNIVNATIYGSNASVSGNGTATTNNNTVIIHGNIKAHYGLYGGMAETVVDGTATASNNTVIIHGNIDMDAVGVRSGASAVNGNGIAIANHNTLIIHGDLSSYSGYAVGGIASVFGDGAATTNNNTVIIQGDISAGYGIYGGKAEISVDGTASANKNTVIINANSTVQSPVYGGAAEVPGVGTASANSNVVTIHGGSSASSIHVGSVNYVPVAAGNTLNVIVDNNTVTLANGADGLEFLNITIRANQNAPVLDINSNVIIGDATTSGAMTLNTFGGTPPMRINDEVQLFIGNGGLIHHDDTLVTTAIGKHGATLLYQWGVYNDIATLLGTFGNPEAKVLSKAYLAGLSSVMMGSDLGAGKGMYNAMKATGSADGGRGSFGAMSGGSIRSKTGSHVDTNGFSLMAGLAQGRNLDQGRMTLGGFLEWGIGSYSIYNAFPNAASSGDGGSTWNFGVGALGRMDFSGNESGNFYTEGSARIGYLDNKYKNSNLADSTGVQATYDSSAMYYGIHLGGGYLLNLNSKALLDIHGKYFWTHVGSDSVTLSTGDHVKFSSVNSHRARAGTRLTYETETALSPYAGLAFEYEFDGKAKAQSFGYSIGTPSLKGSTGIVEAGLSIKASESRPLYLDVGIQGYAGKRKGVTGSMQLRYTF